MIYNKNQIFTNKINPNKIYKKINHKKTLSKDKIPTKVQMQINKIVKTMIHQGFIKKHMLLTNRFNKIA